MLIVGILTFRVDLPDRNDMELSMNLMPHTQMKDYLRNAMKKYESHPHFPAMPHAEFEDKLEHFCFLPLIKNTGEQFDIQFGPFVAYCIPYFVKQPEDNMEDELCGICRNIRSVC